MVRNQDIREALKNKNVYTWELAERIGVHETTLYRYLRKDLSSQEKQRYLELITEIANIKTK